MPDVARYHRQTMLKRGSGNHQIRAFMAESAREAAPSPRRRQVDGENPITIQRDHAVQLGSQQVGKYRIAALLPNDPLLYFSDGHDAHVQICRPLVRDPSVDLGVALSFAQYRQHIGIDQKHQKSTDRGDSRSRSNSSSSCGIASNNSANVGAFAFSR